MSNEFPESSLTLYDTIPTFNNLEKKKPFESIERKGENVGNQHFLLFPLSFLPYQRKTAPFEPHLNCHLQMLSGWIRLKICRFVKD